MTTKIMVNDDTGYSKVLDSKLYPKTIGRNLVSVLSNVRLAESVVGKLIESKDYTYSSGIDADYYFSVTISDEVTIRFRSKDGNYMKYDLESLSRITA